jgi:hypothetical protein
MSWTRKAVNKTKRLERDGGVHVKQDDHIVIFEFVENKYLWHVSVDTQGCVIRKPIGETWRPNTVPLKPSCGLIDSSMKRPAKHMPSSVLSVEEIDKLFSKAMW